jgi:twitching motility protein PilI
MSLSNSNAVMDRISTKPDALARRTRLREFQAQLVERMQAVRSGAEMHVSQLGVMIGQTRWLLNLQEAGEIVSIGAISSVPLTADWFLGLANIRGNLVSVIDFARFQGMSSTAIDKESRIVVFAPALSINSGLLVSRVMGLRNISEMTLQESSSPNEAPWMQKRYVDGDFQVWTELNLSLIAQDPQFLQVGI